MRVLFAGQNDWGSAHRLAGAMNAAEPESARTYVMRAHPFGFEYDLVGADGLEEARELAHAADWIVCTDGDYPSFAALLVQLGAPSARRGVLHVGTAYRTHWSEADVKDRKAGFELRLVNPDLMRFCLHATAHAWPIPPICPQGLPMARLGGNVSVCHSPSTRRRDTKGTAKILRALGDLELHVIENVSFEKCVRLRAKHRLFIDQYNEDVGGYGKSSLEAIAQGLVTFGNLCHVAPEVWERIPKPPIIDVRDIRQLRKEVERVRDDVEMLSVLQKEALRWASGPGSLSSAGRYLGAVFDAA